MSCMDLLLCLPHSTTAYILRQWHRHNTHSCYHFIDKYVTWVISKNWHITQMPAQTYVTCISHFYTIVLCTCCAMQEPGGAVCSSYICFRTCKNRNTGHNSQLYQSFTLPLLPWTPNNTDANMHIHQPEAVQHQHFSLQTKKNNSLQSKFSQNKISKFKKMEKRVTFLTLHKGRSRVGPDGS